MESGAREITAFQAAAPRAWSGFKCGFTTTCRVEVVLLIAVTAFQRITSSASLALGLAHPARTRMQAGAMTHHRATTRQRCSCRTRGMAAVAGSKFTKRIVSRGRDARGT